MNKEKRQTFRKVRVASPCEQPWENMTGSNSKRLCHQCQLNVYNFSEMTEAEIAETLSHSASSGQRICAKIYRRFDGTILTKDCPVGIHAMESVRYAMLSILAFVGVIVSVIFSFASGTLTSSISQSFSTIVNQLGRLNPIPNDWVDSSESKSRLAQTWLSRPLLVVERQEPAKEADDQRKEYLNHFFESEKIALSLPTILDIQALALMPSLASLELHCDFIDIKALRLLKLSKSIKNLELWTTVDGLHQLPPQLGLDNIDLISLHVRAQRRGAIDMTKIPRDPNIKRLELSGLYLKNAEHLAHFRSLECLQLSLDDIPAAAYESIKSLDHLTELGLYCRYVDLNEVQKLLSKLQTMSISQPTTALSETLTGWAHPTSLFVHSDPEPTLTITREKSISYSGNQLDVLKSIVTHNPRISFIQCYDAKLLDTIVHQLKFTGKQFTINSYTSPKDTSAFEKFPVWIVRVQSLPKEPSEQQ